MDEQENEKLDFEEINKEYLKLKKEIESLKKEIDDKDLEGYDLAAQKASKKLEAKKAESNKDNDAKAKAEVEIKEIDKKLDKIRKELKEKRQNLEKLNDNLNEKIAQIRENPEMREYLDEVISKKYARKLRDLKKEKEEVVNKKERMVELKKLVDEHPSLANNLKGILSATVEIKKLEAELDSLKDPKDPLGKTYTDKYRADEIINQLIPNLNNKISKNKSTLMSYIEKNKLNIKEEDIDEISNNRIITSSKGEVLLDATINDVNISQLNKKIKGYDKSIRNYEKAYERYNDGRLQDDEHEGEARGNNNEEKPKWYQFIKRFKNWNERRKQKALPEPEQPTSGASTKKEFKSSYKYEVVQDIIKEQSKEDMKQVKEVMKQAREEEQR